MTNAEPTQTPYRVPPALEPRSPWLGHIGLGIVALAFVLSVAAVIPTGAFLAESMYAAGYFTNPDIALLPDGIASAASQQIAIVELLAAFGTAGWIASIVAAVTHRGRKTGIPGIIVGALAPFLIGGVLVVSVAAHLPAPG